MTEMKVVHKAFKFRIYPGPEQKSLLSIEFGHARFVYNYFLAARMIYYHEHKEDKKKGLTYNETSKLLTALKKDKDHLWLREADSQSLQSALRNLDRAYSNFFAKRSKYPQFKKKSKGQSCHFPQRFVIDPAARSIRVPKVGVLKAVLHRELDGRPLGVTISKTSSGMYFASVTCEVELLVPGQKDGEVGVDLGLNRFATLSDERVIENPRHMQKGEVRLKRLQRKLSRQVKGSASWEKTRLLLARQSEWISARRKDFLHKVTHELVSGYGFIGIETLNVAGMLKNHKLARSISDVGWSEFIRQLEYKAAWVGTQVVQIGMFEPSTKECHHCESIQNGLTLADREWQCPECRSVHDRDLNAAKVILKKARAGAARRNAGGENGRPVAAMQLQADLYETGNLLL